jgi:hypothetical protein
MAKAPAPTSLNPDQFSQLLEGQKQIVAAVKENTAATNYQTQVLRELFANKELYKLDPQEISLDHDGTTEKAIIADHHQKRTYSLLISINQVSGTWASTDYVGVGRNGQEVLKLWGLGDYVIYNVYDSVRDGYVRAITERGINVSTPWGNKFYKWCHIKEVHKKEEN